MMKKLAGLLCVIALLGSCDLVLGPKPADTDSAADVGGAEGVAGVGNAALGNLIVNLGAAGDTGRAISSGVDLPADVLSSLRYELTLIGPGDETLTRTVSAGDTLSMAVALGSWRIDASAYQDTAALAGTGSVTITVGLGTNSVRVPMYMSGDCYEITVDFRTVYGTVRSNFTAAFPGTTITITAEEDPDVDAVYIDGSLEARTASIPVTVSNAGTSGSFTMPAEDVGLYADFRQFVRYVRAGGAGYETGTSWDDASGDLQKMMDDLERPIPGYTGPRIVKVGAGTYNPEWTPVIRDVVADLYPYTYTAGGRDSAFILRNGVQVWGGYPASGGEDSSRNIAANSTTLSGDLNSNGTDAADAYHVVLAVDIPAAGGTVLDGLTISGGNANGSGNISVGGKTINQNDGGGMYNNNSSPVLTNVTISNNTAKYGGGMYNDNSSPVLENVTISGNAALDYGGGMYNVNSSPTLINVMISGHTLRYSGGGIYNTQNSSPVLINVKISGNHTTYNGISMGGGGIFNFGAGCNPVLINVLISGNKAAVNGGGIYNADSSPVLINVTIAGNFADSGGGIASLDSARPKFYNSIICGNTANDGNKDIGEYWGGNTTLYNSIKDSNPQFAAPSGNPAPTPDGDYSLQSGSQAINAGDNSTYPDNATHAVFSGIALSPDARLAINTALGKDLAGNTRVQGTAIDMGAYEKE